MAVRVATGVCVMIAVFVAGRIAIGLAPHPLTENPPAPAGLENALSLISSSTDCLEADAAEAEIRSKLVALSLADWRVQRDAGVQPSSCVSWAIDTLKLEVLLMPRLSVTVRQAIDDFAARSYAVCMTRDEAAAGITDTLHGVGETAWDLRFDGPVGGPLNRLAEIEEHVKSGCFIYSGTGWGEDGRRLFFLAGP